MAKVNSSHSYLQKNYNIPTIPPAGSKFKGLKKIVSRCIAFFTAAQNDFNANVVRTFDNLQIQLENLEQHSNLHNKKLSDIDSFHQSLNTEFLNFNDQLLQINSFINC